MLSFAQYWPTYPAGRHSTLVLVDAEACAVDDLFSLLFGCNSSFQVCAHAWVPPRSEPLSVQVCRAESIVRVSSNPCGFRCNSITNRTQFSCEHGCLVSVHFLFINFNSPNHLVTLTRLVSWVQERAREARGYTAFSESEWVLEEHELPSLPGGFGWALPPPAKSHQLRGSEYQARMRKVRTILN